MIVKGCRGLAAAFLKQVLERQKRYMKKGQIIEGVIEGIDFPNKGYFHAEDRKIQVKNTLPGQKVSIMVSKLRAGRGEGRVSELLEKAPTETAENVCPHFGICGGCSYQTLPYEEQLKIKSAQVQALLTPVAGEFDFEGIKSSPVQFGYRNKMEFSFGDEVKDGPLALGMHKQGSFYDIVTVSNCQIIDEDYRSILTATLEFFKERRIPFYKKMQHTGYLRHLLVRKAVKTGELLVDLVTTSQTEVLPESNEEKLLAEYKEVLQNLLLTGTYAGILHTVNDSLADVVQNDRTDILYGKNYIYEELLGLRFKITPFSFFQTNSLGAEVLYSVAREYIGETRDKLIFDLYSGTGTIAQILAPVAKKVIGVEIVEEAVEAAKENAALNGLDNCEFIAGDVLKVIDTIEEKPDLIVLDPPRDGIHPKALAKIIDYGVDRIVYISCKPTSLARDLEVFLARGYEVVKGCAVDMFPGSNHVETVVLLSKGEIDSKKVRVEFSLEDMDMSGFQKDATYGQIKERVMQQTGLKVSSLYIAQVKQKHGIIERENYNKPKSEKFKQPKCPPEKEAAITEALKFFGMI